MQLEDVLTQLERISKEPALAARVSKLIVVLQSVEVEIPEAAKVIPLPLKPPAAAAPPASKPPAEPVDPITEEIRQIILWFKQGLRLEHVQDRMVESYSTVDPEHLPTIQRGVVTGLSEQAILASVKK